MALQLRVFATQALFVGFVQCRRAGQCMAGAGRFAGQADIDLAGG